jgi:HK97 family phage prohead protease
METLRDLDLVRAVTLRGIEFRAPMDPDGDSDLTEDPEGNLTDDAEGAQANGTAPADALGTLVSRFSPFDTWYEIDSWWEGRFLEQTARGAFAKTMTEQRNSVVCMFNHGYDMQIDMKLLGTVNELREDPDAAVGEVALWDTSYNRDLLPGLRAGAYGSSFRFRVIREEWNDEPGKSAANPDGIPERTIREVRLYEFGPVTYPANPAATSGMRSLTDQYYEQLRSRDPRGYDRLLARAQELRPHHRTPEADAAQARPPLEPVQDQRTEQGTSADGAAGPETDAPATEATRGLSPDHRAALLRGLQLKELT